MESYVKRFGNHVSSPAAPTPPKPGLDATDQKPIDPALVELIRDAPDARTQAAALTALALGWPDDPVTSEHLEWGRNTPNEHPDLRPARACRSQPRRRLATLFTADEYGFVMSHLYDESQFLEDHRWTGLNSSLVLRAVSEAPAEEREELTEFAEETLRQNPMTGGNRSMCWQLACGPLAESTSLRDWVIAELAEVSDSHPLILYDLESMPKAWTDEPAMKEAISLRIADLLSSMRSEAATLTRALPDEQAKRTLL